MSRYSKLSLSRSGAELGPADIRRYARHLSLASFGSAAQQRLARATVLVVGAGGLGSPVLLYLAAAGVGTIHVADNDEVSESDLQRQVVHGDSDLGRPKVDSAHDSLRELNPRVEVVPHRERIGAANVAGLVRVVDLVVDCTDNFATRYLLNDACVGRGIPLVWASVHEFDGQVAVWWAGCGPCYRCLHPEPPPEGLFASCEDAGVLGSVCAVVGGIQATEAIKVIAGVGESLVGRLLMYDGLSSHTRTIDVSADPGCPTCSTTRTDRWASLAGTAPDRIDDDPVEIDAAELRALLATGEEVALIDCRQAAGEDALAGALHAPLRGLLFQSPSVPPGVPVVVYCEVGRTSLVAASAMRASGLAARSLRGGLEAWRASGASTHTTRSHP